MKLLPEKSDALAIPPRRGLPAVQLRRMLLHEFLRDKSIRGLTKVSLVRYKKVITDFFLHAGDLRPNEFAPRDIREYLAWQMDRGTSTHGLQQQLSVIRSLFAFAEAMGIVAVSPARAIQTRRYIRNLPKFLSEEEINRLIDSEPSIRNKAILTVMYATGSRVAEVAGMHVQDVSWSGRTVLVNGKGSKERLVPLGRRAIALLKQYLDGRDTGWLFQSEGQPDQRGKITPCKSCLATNGIDCGQWRATWRAGYSFGADGKLTWKQKTRHLGKVSEVSRDEAHSHLAQILRETVPPRPRPVKDEPLSEDRIRVIVKKAGISIGVHVHPHMIRHSFATHLLDHGADILAIAKFMGHASLSTTEIYTHVSMRKLHETLEQFHPHWREQNENKS